MVLLALCADAVIGNVQEGAMKAGEGTNTEMVRGVVNRKRKSSNFFFKKKIKLFVCRFIIHTRLVECTSWFTRCSVESSLGLWSTQRRQVFILYEKKSSSLFSFPFSLILVFFFLFSSPHPPFTPSPTSTATVLGNLLPHPYVLHRRIFWRLLRSGHGCAVRCSHCSDR